MMRERKRRILVVDDEEDIVELLKYNLEREGFDVLTAYSGDACIESVGRHAPDLLVLDLMMPGLDGLEVCRRLRSDASTATLPIVILTAKTDEVDVVLGLEMGADDYVQKPFSPRELVARIKTVLRRSAGSFTHAPGVLRHGGIVLDPEARSVVVCGDDVELTFSEFEILRLMMAHPGRVFSRQQIMKTIREDEFISTERSVDVQILNLRRKLGAEASAVKTVRGAGYKFNA